MSEPNDPIRVAQKLAKPELPKRFYRSVTVAEEAGGAVVRLDERTLKTPRRSALALPSRELAEAIAAEWDAQADEIDPATMPVTRLVNAAVDAVMASPDPVRAEIVAYAGNDLLCYRADGPAGLVERQAELWDPPMEWLAREHTAPLAIVAGVVPVDQPQASLDRITTIVERYEGYALAALHSATTLTGSAILALAHGEGQLAADTAWQAAHVDEDWQIGQWGEDAEASARRAARWREMEAAALVLAEVRR